MQSHRPPQARTDWPGVAYGVALGVLAAYQQFKLPPALPLLFQQYGYDRLLAGGFMSVYALTGLTLSVPIGRALACRGPEGLLLAAFVFLVGGNLLGLLLPEFGLLMLASRLCEGLAFAVLAVVGGVVATTSAVGRDRLIAVGLWTTWIPLGQVFSSLLAVPVTGAGFWRPLWWAGILTTALVVAWGWRLRSGQRAILQTPRTDPRQTPQPGDGKTVTQRQNLLLLAALLFSLWTTQYLAFVSWLPQYLVEAHGLSPGRAALVYLLPPALIVPFNLIAGAMLRGGAKLALLLPASVLVQAGVWLAVPVLGPGPSGATALFAYGVSCGITPTCLFALPNAILGDGPGAAHGFAVLMTGRNLGALVGPLLLAQAVLLASGWNVVAPLFGGLCVLAACLGAYVAGRLPARTS